MIPGFIAKGSKAQRAVAGLKLHTYREEQVCNPKPVFFAETVPIELRACQGREDRGV